MEDVKLRHEALLRNADERIREEKMAQEKLKAEIVTNQTQITGLTQMLQVLMKKLAQHQLCSDCCIVKIS